MPEFVGIDALVRKSEARREATLDRGSPYREVQGNPFANDCPLPNCAWDGKADRDLADHLGERHGDLSIRQRAGVLARRKGRVVQIAAMRSRSVKAVRRGAHEARG